MDEWKICGTCGDWDCCVFSSMWAVQEDMLGRVPSVHREAPGVDSMGMRLLLIVEDHQATRRSLAALFRRSGWDVAEATNVAEGLAKLDPPPDFIVLDLMLPDGGGEVVLERVRER